MRYILTTFLVFIVVSLFSQSNNKQNTKSSIEIFEKSISTLEKDVSKQSSEVLRLNTEVKYLKVLHEEQVLFYERTIDTMLWIVGIACLFLTAVFTMIIWFFKEPKEIWSKLKIIKKDAFQLLEELESQHRYQESLFILGKKSFFDFSYEDWKTVEQFASKAKSINEKKRSANDWYFIGLISYHKTEFHTAIIAYNKAIDLKNNFSHAIKGLGITYLETGEADKAILYFNRALAIDPQNFNSINNLGIAYCAKGQYELAISNFKKCIELSPNQGSLFTNLFELYTIRDKVLGKKLVKTFKKRFSDDKKAMGKFEMLKVLMNIRSGNELEHQLEKWNNSGFLLPFNEDFSEIEKWIEKESDNAKKKDLQSAIQFFKTKKEKSIFN